MMDRHFKLIKILMDGKIHPENECAYQLNVTTRSIRSYVSKINTEMNDILQILRRRRKGYYLQIKDTKKLNFLFKQKDYLKLSDLNDSNMRRRKILHKLLFANSPCKLDDLAIQMYISRTTLINDIEIIKKEIEPFNLTIKGKPNYGITLDGTEIDKRVFIVEHIYEVSLNKFMLNAEHKKYIEHYFEKMNLTGTTLERFYHYVNILLLRKKAGFEVVKGVGKYKNIMNKPEYNLVSQLLTWLSNKTGYFYQIGDIIFATIPLVTRNTSVNEEIVISGEVKDIVNVIIDRIQKQTSIVVDNQELLHLISKHIQLMISRVKYGVQEENPLQERIQGLYPLAFQMAKIASDVICEKHSIQLTKAELSYLAMYFGSFVETERNKNKQAIHLVVISNQGQSISRLFLSRLKNLIRHQVVIDIMTKSEFIQFKPDVSLIISLESDFSSEDTPVYYINNILTLEREAEKLNRFIELSEYTSLSNSSTYIESIFQADLFFVQNVTNYKEALRIMVNQLAKKEYVDDDFYHRLIQKEKSYYSIFSTGVSIAHMYTKKNKPINISIMNLETPVIWSENDVQIIFLVSIPERNKNLDLLIKIYDELISIASNRWLVSELREVKSYTDFKSYLNKNSKVILKEE